MTESDNFIHGRIDMEIRARQKLEREVEELKQYLSKLTNQLKFSPHESKDYELQRQD